MPCSWPFHIRLCIANELCLTHQIHRQTLLLSPPFGWLIRSWYHWVCIDDSQPSLFIISRANQDCINLFKINSTPFHIAWVRGTFVEALSVPAWLFQCIRLLGSLWDAILLLYMCTCSEAHVPHITIASIFASHLRPVISINNHTSTHVS